MNQNNVMLWVNALRSGAHDQGRERLTRVEDDGYEFDCCLGVACKVAIDNGVELKVEVEESINQKYKTYNGEAEWLPEVVGNWLGVNERDPILHDNGLGGITATGLNDNQDYDFEQIANAIEARLNEGA